MTKNYSRTFILLCTLGCLTAVKAQNGPITFESGEAGATWTWTAFENGLNTAPTTISNPDKTGNNSATVLKTVAEKDGAPWAGFESKHGTDLGSFTFNSSNCIVKIKVWKSVISDVGLKFASASGASKGELKVPNTVMNQWEELVFDFSANIGEVNDQIIIYTDFRVNPKRTQNDTSYIDDIVFTSKGPALGEPQTAAPTPTEPATSVISLFSNAYTNVPVTTWKTDWSKANLQDLEIDKNATKKYSNLDFTGIETTGSDVLDITEMNAIHVDLWTPNANSIRLKLVDFGANNIYQGGDDTEHEIVFNNISTNKWMSYNIPLDSFRSLVGRKNLSQIIFSAKPTSEAIVYLDNLYFTKNTSAVNTMIKSKIAVYPNPSNGLFEILGNESIQNISVCSIDGKQIDFIAVNAIQKVLDLSRFPKGLYLLNIQTANSINSSKIIIE